MFRCAKASPFFPRRFLDSLLFLVFDPNPLAPPSPPRKLRVVVEEKRRRNEEKNAATMSAIGEDSE